MSIENGDKSLIPDWDAELEKLTGQSVDESFARHDEENYEQPAEVLTASGSDEASGGEKTPLITVNYGISIEEEERAFKLFQKLFVTKKNIVKTVLFGLAAAAFAVQIIMGKGDSISWGLMTVCLAFIAVVWITPVRVRKFLMQALEALKDDRYVLRVFDSGFEIETIIPQEDIEIASEIDKAEGDDDDEDIEKRLKPETSKYSFDRLGLKLVETDEMFMIFVGKETYHILPKRALNRELATSFEISFIPKFSEHIKA